MAARGLSSRLLFMGFNENSGNNSNPNETSAVDSNTPISSALIAFSNGANFEIFLFGAFVSVRLFNVLILNIIPRWGWKGTRPMRLSRWERYRHWCSSISSELVKHGIWLQWRVRGSRLFTIRSTSFHFLVLGLVGLD